MTSAAHGAVATVGGEPDALARALASGASWLWFLAKGARPHEDALERLLAAIEPEDAPVAVVLAGLLVDEGGAPLGNPVQAAPRLDTDAAIRLVRQCLLPIRSVGFAHCLVARTAFSRHGLPDLRSFGPFAAEEWTARVLAQEPGYLVPASVVTLPAHAEQSLRGASLVRLRATLHMLPTGTWSRGDAARGLWRALTELRPT